MIKLHFKTLTPIHISNGEQLGFGLDYLLLCEIQEENGDKFKVTKLCKLNPNKVADKFAKNNLFDLSRNYSLIEIIDNIEKNKNHINTDDLFYKVIITKPFSNYLNRAGNQGQAFVSEFINSNGKFYIPASSIKGALLTILNVNHLGIKEIKNNGIVEQEATIKDKIVFSDSDFIDQSNFNIFRTNNRPPEVNLMCLKKNTEFTMIIKKTGSLKFEVFKEKLKKYSKDQIELALKNITTYKSKKDEPKGADIFESALTNLNTIKLSSDEYLINIGFGGGSWFKVNKGVVPKFESKKKGRGNPNEAAHTSVSFNENPMHIGWCKLKIEEI